MQRHTDSTWHRNVCMYGVPETMLQLTMMTIQLHVRTTELPKNGKAVLGVPDKWPCNFQTWKTVSSILMYVRRSRWLSHSCFIVIHRNVLSRPMAPKETLTHYIRGGKEQNEFEKSDNFSNENTLIFWWTQNKLLQVIDTQCCWLQIIRENGLQCLKAQLKLLIVKITLAEKLIFLLCTLTTNSLQEEFFQTTINAEVRLVKMVLNSIDGKVKTLEVRLVVVSFTVVGKCAGALPSSSDQGTFLFHGSVGSSTSTSWWHLRTRSQKAS